MEDIIIKFKNLNAEEQMMMFQNLTSRLQLLKITTFRKNANMIPDKIIANVSMSRLVELYNNAKSEELRIKIISDKFFRRAFKKTKNFPNVEYDINTPFFQNIAFIVEKIYENQKDYANCEQLKFINRYSPVLFFPTSTYSYRVIFDLFFQDKTKEHNIPISLLDRLKTKEILNLYDHYANLPNQSINTDSQIYVGNLQEFETYLKDRFANDSETYRLVKDANSFLSKNESFRRIYGENIINSNRYDLDEAKMLLCLYFRLNGATLEDENKVLNFFAQKIHVNFADLSEDKTILQYLIHKNLQVNPARVVEIMYGHYGYFHGAEIGNSLSEIAMLLYFNFLPLRNYQYNNEYLEGYDLSLLSKFNFSHLKKIFSALDPHVYGDEMAFGFRIVINMYIAFGYNRTLDILKGKYGELSKDFFNNISKIKISNDLLDNKNNIKLNQGYLNILFNQEKNSNFQQIINNYTISPLIYFLYNNYDFLVSEYGKLNLKKCIDLLNKQSNITVEPRYNQLVRKDIYNNIIVGNRRNKKLDYLMNTIINNFSQQQERLTSTIPYLEGEYAGYTYQTMRFNDPIVYNLGYLANCCFRITDLGEKDLKHASLDKNARILLVYNENKEVIAFSVLNRNGEVVIITSVEYDSRNNDIDSKKIVYIIKKFADELYLKINSSNGDRIRLITIGASSKIKPVEIMPFPSKYPIPVCANEDKYQANFYHTRQHIILKDDDLNYHDLKYNIELKTYQDPRLPIQRVIINESNLEDYTDLIQRINNNYAIDIFNVGDILIYNEDWYILIKNNGEIISKVLDYDNRAIQEYNKVKNSLEEHVLSLSSDSSSLENSSGLVRIRKNN